MYARFPSFPKWPDSARKRRVETPDARWCLTSLNLEAGVGIEPAYTALQAVNSAFDSRGCVR